MSKLIGIIGGTSWPSTISYYEELNRIANQKLGGYHSARILLYSIDYNKIKSNYGVNFQAVEEELHKEISFFMQKKPDCLIIANNTLHKAYDNIKLNLQIPLFHAGKLSAELARKNGFKSVLLFGTKFTMEDGFFANYFKNEGIKIVTPNLEDRNKIGDIQSKISSGIKDNNFFKEFETIISNYKADAICLACTELPIFITKENCKLPIINPSQLQILSAIEFALN